MENTNIINDAITNENENTSTSIKRDFAPHRRASTRICKTCGKFYVISDNDVVYYVQKFGTMPLRCDDCRAKNRTETTENND